jgi:hypothetical protein
MATAALRIEESFPIPLPPDPCLEVTASYRGVLLGARYLSERVTTRRPGYVIGESPHADAPAPSALLGCPDLPLVSRWSQGFLVNVTPGMTGDVAVGGKVYRLTDYLAGRGNNFTLPQGGRARIECGAMTFGLCHTSSITPLPRRWFAWRWSEQRFTLGTFLGLALFMLTIFAIPPQGATASVDFTGMTHAFVPYDLTAQQVPEAPEFLSKQPKTGQGEAGKAHAGQSGKMGDNKSKKPTGRYAIQGDGRDMHIGKEQAETRIRELGILGIIGKASGSRFASIFGRGSAVGDAQEDVIGNLLAANIDDGYGMSGLGLTGTGNGGGGTGLTSIGIGNFNTLGGGYGHDRGIGSLAKRPPPRGPEIIPGKVTARGSLDKEIIRRVVRLHMNEVKFCYDQELVRSTGLGGRVSVQFLIAGNGQVINSFVQSTTMNNVRVESCVVGAVKRWTFPKPEGGGIAIVSYPFNFVAGN